jgi:hypothetical protein
MTFIKYAFYFRADPSVPSKLPLLPSQVHSYVQVRPLLKIFFWCYVMWGCKAATVKSIRVLRILDAYPGSDFFPSRILELYIFHAGSDQRISFNSQKIGSKLSEIWSGLFIPDPGSGSWFFLPLSRGQKGIRIRIRNTAKLRRFLNVFMVLQFCGRSSGTSGAETCTVIILSYSS